MDPSKPASGRFGTVVAWVGLIGSLGVLGYGVSNRIGTDVSAVEWGVVLAGPAVGVIVAWILFRSDPRRRDEWALAAVAIVLALYAAEGGLRLLDLEDAAARRHCSAAEGEDAPFVTAYEQCLAATRRGRPFDSRSIITVLEELEARGEDPVPAINAIDVSAAFAERSPYPLGGIANRTTVYCNKLGSFVTYRSDSFGFRNPPGADDGPLRIALIGDSYTKGHCVAEDETIPGRVRVTHPATLQFGIDGAGALTALAALREYVAPRRPATVVWTLYEGNDLDDLARELRTPALVRYLNPDYSQDLASRVTEVDSVLLDFLPVHLEATLRERAALRREANGTGIRATGVVRFALLSRLRGLVRSARGEEEGLVQVPAELLDRFDEVARRIRDDVEGWGGRLLVIYLPEWKRFAHPGWKQKPREKMIGLLRADGIEVVDATPAFGGRDDPLELWPFRQRGHFGPEGYGLVADLVLERLSR